MKPAQPAMRYPVRDASDWSAYRSAPVLRRLKFRWRHARLSLFGKGIDPQLSRMSGSFAPLRADDLPLVCVMRNAVSHLKAFLRHYRGLGVTRFIVVDDRSTDGTAEILAAAPDVDLFGSQLRYAGADGGCAWRDALFGVYGRGRWYLSVDSDEFLVFPRMEERGVRDFIAELAGCGISRCLAPMIDMYPPGRLSDGVFVDDGATCPFEVSSCFDGDGYFAKQERFGVAVRGGPRLRLFGRNMRLSKFPLLWVDGSTDYRRGSIHGPGPCFRNCVPATGALLHYRFSARSLEEFRRIAEEKSHAGGSEHYRAILGDARFSEDLSLMYEGSVRYAGPECLVGRGFMADLRDLSAAR